MDINIASMRNRHFTLAAIVCAAFTIGSSTISRADSIADLSGLSYRGIGPAIGVGRTTAVVGSNADNLFYLAGGADGGVFKSTDGGSVWSPVFDHADAAAIGAIAIAPDNTQDIWVGTGEANPRNDVAGGDGIWHSTDGGKTWRHAGLDDAGSISSISIDPRDSHHVVVGVLGQIFRDSTMRGVYVTRDDGAHWQRTLYVGPSTGVSDMTRLPDRPDTMFAGLYELRRKPWTMMSGGPSGGLFRSDDGGDTWHRVTASGLPPSPTGRIGVSAGPNNRVYAVIQSSAGDLWRSDDGGSTWRLMPHSYIVGARRFYFSRITVDPANADRLISVGLELSMSTNGGKSFHRISGNAGWDYHVVWWSHDGTRIVVGSDEGVVMSGDGGTTWRQPYMMPFGQAYHIGFDNDLPNYHVCIGLQDDSSWCGLSNSDSGLGVLDRDWWTVGPGDGMWALYDPNDPHLIWNTSTASDSGQVYLFDTRTQQADEVSPDAEQNGGMPAHLLAYRFNWDSPLAFTADGKVLAGGNVVWESGDHGVHWTRISPDLTRNEKSHQQITGGPIDMDMSGAESADNLLALATTPLDSSMIWAGTDDGLVQLTRDGGAHWMNVTPRGAPYWGRVPCVEPGRFDAATAFVAFDNHMLGDNGPYIYATHDYGATWRSIATDLPKDLFVRSIRQDTVNANLLYAGTQRGVWASWDGGAHWRSLRLNMPASAVYDIEIQPQRDDLLVATHGRGAWVFDDLRPLQELQKASASSVTLFALRDTYRWFQSAPINSFQNGSLPANLFHGPNVDYGAYITYALASSKHKKATIEIVDASGHVIRHMSGKDVPHKAGFNRVAWDLTVDGPTKWLGTFKDNQGPATGAEALPGIYDVRLTVDGITQQKEVTVKADPRDPATPDQMQLRYTTLTKLYGELSGVDAMLNSLDHQLSAKNLASSKRAQLLALHAQLTFAPKNVEDLGGPGGLRDRLNDLIGRISSSSLQAPTQPQLDYAATLQTQYANMARAFHNL
jgi:photosystem II stability/assembly factor-like uncharacterized protein